MNKISEYNPKDTVLDEIHSIQKRKHSERKDLRWEEEKNLIDKNVNDFGKKHKIKFKIVAPDKVLSTIK